MSLCWSVQRNVEVDIEKGGETPINNSVLLYRHLKEIHPEFIEELEKRASLPPHHSEVPKSRVKS